MEENQPMDDDTVAMGNLAYVLAYLADLDYQYRAASGIGVLLYRNRNGVDGYELRISTAVEASAGELSIVDTVALLDSPLVAHVARALAEGVEAHGRTVKNFCADLWPSEREQGR